MILILSKHKNIKIGIIQLKKTALIRFNKWKWISIKMNHFHSRQHITIHKSF